MSPYRWFTSDVLCSSYGQDDLWKELKIWAFSSFFSSDPIQTFWFFLFFGSFFVGLVVVGLNPSSIRETTTSRLSVRVLFFLFSIFSGTPPGETSSLPCIFRETRESVVSVAFLRRYTYWSFSHNSEWKCCHKEKGLSVEARGDKRKKEIYISVRWGGQRCFRWVEGIFFSFDFGFSLWLVLAKKEELTHCQQVHIRLGRFR